MSPLRVFLCCSHSDVGHVDVLRQSLLTAGADVWLADAESMPFDAIQREFSVRPVVLIMLSKAALTSVQVNQVAKAVTDLGQRDPTRLMLSMSVETIDPDALNQWPFLSTFRRIVASPGEALPIRQVMETLALSPINVSNAETSPLQLIERGKALLAQQRCAEAHIVLGDATQRTPDAFDGWFNLSVALNGRSRFHEASGICDWLLKLRPADAIAWSQKAETMINLRLFRDALATADQALRLDAASPRALTSKGLALASLHRYQEGLMICDEALRLAPYDVRTWHSKGLILRRYNMFPQAMAATEQALALNPYYAPSLMGKANILTQQSRFSKNANVSIRQVFEMLDAALQFDPENVSILMGKALLLQGAAHQQQAALQTIDFALSLDPQNAHAWSAKAMILNEAGKFRDAMAAAEHALTLNRNETQAWYAKGEIYFRQKKFREAIAAFDAGLQADPDDEELLNDKGAALQGLGRRAEAIAAYDHVLRLNPNHELARRNRASV